MGSLRPKLENWTVEQLCALIVSKQVTKPQCQRRKFWQPLPAANGSSKPNYLDYIKFLFKTCSTVEAVTLAKYITGDAECYVNIDGNNRLSAIIFFYKHPLRLLQDNFQTVRANTLYRPFIEFLCNISYPDLTRIRRMSRYITHNAPGTIQHLWHNVMDSATRDYIDDQLEFVVTPQLKVDGGYDFHLNVIINVVIFTNPEAEQLAYIFACINQHPNPLSTADILAATLITANKFSLQFDVHLKTALMQHLHQFYEAKNEGELLECYTSAADESKPMNGGEFLIAFHNYCAEKYANVLLPFDGGSDGPFHLLFACEKLFYSLQVHQFTTEHVQQFVGEMLAALDLLSGAVSRLCPGNLDMRPFKKDACVTSLSKSTLCTLLACIIKLRRDEKNVSELRLRVAKVLAFHLLASHVDCKDFRVQYQAYDVIKCTGSNIKKALLTALGQVSDFGAQVTREIYLELLRLLVLQYNVPYTGLDRPGRRRTLSFPYRFLLGTYYNAKVPYNYTLREQNVDHIVPFSTQWTTECIDLDRLGNLIIFDAELNKGRKNTSIRYYVEKDRVLTHCLDFPSLETYAKIVTHSRYAPQLTDVAEYDRQASFLEELYISTAVQAIFPI